MPEIGRIPLYYTFGNHMHWVDMEWLWGYFVMPSSVRDMIHFCKQTGAKGNVNFDGIGYEKLAVEAPEALQELREAVQSGMIEVVGASYGQPYGLFHGGESNVRQRVYGVRSVMRLLGVRPKTFWEEEFDFFPQLPQMLRGVGFEYASLFFQWTWHTPEVPREEVPVVWWEGQDGSRLLTATRNRLNLHQWPEDMDILLAELAGEAEGSNVEGQTSNVPLILQWLELMPSPDWMCRSELLLPKLKQILADERFEIKHATLGEYLAGVGPEAHAVPVRRYTMDDVWHGMTLGKNADFMRRESIRTERYLRDAETLAAVAGILGRPYAQWDVYPTWELEEGWRELLAAQHHDNDECEGLCGYVGKFSYSRARSLANHIRQRTLRNLGKRFGNPVEPLAEPNADGATAFESTTILVFNTLGWARTVVVGGSAIGGSRRTLEVPAFGFAVVSKGDLSAETVEHVGMGLAGSLKGQGWSVDVDSAAGVVRQLVAPDFPEGVFAPDGGFGARLRRNGAPVEVTASSRVDSVDEEGRPTSVCEIHSGPDHLGMHVALDLAAGAIDVRLHSTIARPDGGLNAALQTGFVTAFRPRIIADQPYGVAEVHPIEKGLKKYPTGDWMTSPQWFEAVHRPFFASSLVDLIDADNPDRGLLILHDGSQQWFADEQGVRCVLNAHDPWDEDYFIFHGTMNFRLIPHGPMSHSQRWRLAQEFRTPPLKLELGGVAERPRQFEFLSCDAPNVCLTALYRETLEGGKHLPAYAGNADGMNTGYPYVIRAVEFDGLSAETSLTVAGTVAAAYKTNLLGEVEQRLDVSQRDGRSTISLSMRAYEIATIYLDIVEGRKQTRDLDAKREIWATVHRVDS